jgi:TPR repeat protein/beta-lactamase regulating signal transducer with metallopeptidase domain
MMTIVLDHLWQSTLFAALAAFLTLAFRENRANTRFCIWLAASVKFLIPISPVVAIFHTMTWRAASSSVVPISPLIVEPAAPIAAMPVAHVSLAAAVPAEPASVSIVTILFAVWACGAAATYAWWLVRWLRMRAILRNSLPLQLDAPIPIKSSPALLEPGLFGVFRPVLVLPEGIVASLTRQQLDAILAHELAHWRRHDNLSAALHMIVEGLFWFHPLVWWIGRRLVVERERACDEAVIQSRCERKAYAEAILTVCRSYLCQPLPCVSGVTGGDLQGRVAAIMTGRIGARLQVAKKLMLTAVICGLIGVPVAMGVTGAWRAAAAALEDGLGAFNRGDYATALKQLRPLAEQGNAVAQHRLGRIYDGGLGVKQDYAQAAEWYRKAAVQANLDAQWGLSDLYRLGHGAPKDRIEASRWFRPSALRMFEPEYYTCDPTNQFSLHGDTNSASNRAAAERGDAEAQSDLGSFWELGFPNGEHADHREALKWIGKAAGQGYAKAEAALASMYLKGSAVPPTKDAALTWMRKAAEQGLIRAQCSLAVMYEKGIGVAPDHAQAAAWYRRVVDNKANAVPDPDRELRDIARTKLGLMYGTGDGVPRNDAQALTLLRSAADDGMPLAEARLGIKYASGDGVKQDGQTAVRLLDSAAGKGVSSAEIALGRIYAKGLDTPPGSVRPDLALAYKWFNLAARYPASLEDRDVAMKESAAVAARMSRQEIAEGERLIQAWTPTPEIAAHMFSI